MPRDKRDIEAALRGKGFRQAEGDHGYFIYYSLDGRKAQAYTKTSHGSRRDVGDALLGQMARQCGLTKLEFDDLIACPLDRQRYEQMLRARGRL